MRVAEFWDFKILVHFEGRDDQGSASNSKNLDSSYWVVSIQKKSGVCSESSFSG